MLLAWATRKLFHLEQMVLLTIQNRLGGRQGQCRPVLTSAQKLRELQFYGA